MTKFKTLHEAINFVLKKNNNQFMSFEEISNAIENKNEIRFRRNFRVF